MTRGKKKAKVDMVGPIFSERCCEPGELTGRLL